MLMNVEMILMVALKHVQTLKEVSPVDVCFLCIMYGYVFINVVLISIYNVDVDECAFTMEQLVMVCTCCMYIIIDVKCNVLLIVRNGFHCPSPQTLMYY